MTHVFKPGDKATCGGFALTVLGRASSGMYACEYNNGAVGFLNAGELAAPKPAEPEPVVRWVTLWDDGVTGLDTRYHRPGGTTGLTARIRVVLTPGQFDDENTPDPYTRGWNEALEAADIGLVANGFTLTRGGSALTVIRDLRRQP